MKRSKEPEPDNLPIGTVIEEDAVRGRSKYFCVYLGSGFWFTQKGTFVICPLRFGEDLLAGTVSPSKNFLYLAGARIIP